MTADERAFLNAIIAAPDDDLPRLVYADWLDEHGRHERAEFIRLQCAIHQSQVDGTAPAVVADLRERERELYRDYVPEWRLQLPIFSSVRFGDYRRGFIEAARIRPVHQDDSLLKTLTLIQRLFPLRELDVIVDSASLLERLLEWPQLNGFRGLRFIPPSDWTGRTESVPLARLIVSFPWKQQLGWLELEHWDYRRTGIDAWLTENYRGPHLKLSACRFRPDDQQNVQVHFGDRATL